MGRSPGAEGRPPVSADTAVPTKTAPVEVERPEAGEVVVPDVPWIVIVWNDPINLMTYVTWVFIKLFGYPRTKAEKLMMDVHTKGKAVVSNGTKDECEGHVARLHAYGLWATMQKDR
jgi:ATP-dependent Clp protease adaptor protein ClpS